MQRRDYTIQYNTVPFHAMLFKLIRNEAVIYDMTKDGEIKIEIDRGEENCH